MSKEMLAAQNSLDSFSVEEFAEQVVLLKTHRKENPNVGNGNGVYPVSVLTEAERDVLKSKQKIVGGVYEYLLSHANGLPAIVCSYTVIAEALDISYSSVKKAIQFLLDKNIINSMQTGNGRAYILTPMNGYADSEQIRHYGMQAAVIVSNSEQNIR